MTEPTGSPDRVGSESDDMSEKETSSGSPDRADR